MILTISFQCNGCTHIDLYSQEMGSAVHLILDFDKHNITTYEDKFQIIKSLDINGSMKTEMVTMSQYCHTFGIELQNLRNLFDK